MVLLTNVKNVIDRACSKWGCFKENRCYKTSDANNQNGTAEILGIKKEERHFGEFKIWNEGNKNE